MIAKIQSYQMFDSNSCESLQNEDINNKKTKWIFKFLLMWPFFGYLIRTFFDGRTVFKGGLIEAIGIHQQEVMIVSVLSIR